jgi:transcriptional regulator with XRE-family HTH domain
MLPKDKDISVLLGERLRQMRLAKGWTQEDMQSKGFSYRYYGKIERGAVNPTIETLVRLASVFEINLSDLFRFDFSENSQSTEVEEVVSLINKLIQDNAKGSIKKLKVFLNEILV